MALKNGAVDLQHGTRVEGSSHPGTKPTIPSKQFEGPHIYFILHNIVLILQVKK
jgi:hypothetical protein